MLAPSSAFLGNPRIVTALGCLICRIWRGRGGVCALRCIPGFAPHTCWFKQRRRTRCDPSRSTGHGARGLLAVRKTWKTVRSTSSQGLSAIKCLRSRRRSDRRARSLLSYWPSSRHAAQGVGAPLLSPLSSSMEYLVHSATPVIGFRRSSCVMCAVDRQAADSGCSGRGQAQIFGRSARAPDRYRSTRLALSGFISRRCPGHGQAATALIGGGYWKRPRNAS